LHKNRHFEEITIKVYIYKNNIINVKINMVFSEKELKAMKELDEKLKIAAEKREAAEKKKWEEDREIYSQIKEEHKRKKRDEKRKKRDEKRIKERGTAAQKKHIDRIRTNNKRFPRISLKF